MIGERGEGGRGEGEECVELGLKTGPVGGCEGGRVRSVMVMGEGRGRVRSESWEGEDVRGGTVKDGRMRR